VHHGSNGPVSGEGEADERTSGSAEGTQGVVKRERGEREEGNGAAFQLTMAHTRCLASNISHMTRPLMLALHYASQQQE